MISRDLLGGRVSAWRRARAAAPGRSGPACSCGVDDRQRLLAMGDVGRLLAGRLFRAPDPEQVVVELEGEAERPAEAAIAGDDLVVVGRQQRAGLDRGGDERRGLAPDHVEVRSTRHELVRLARRDVDVLALAQGQAGLVVQAHQAQDLGVGEAEVGQPMEGDARQAEQRVAGVDRLRDAVDRPQRRAVAALGVAVLDVVVDEAEVVPELDGRGAGQRAPVVAGDARRRRAGRAAAASACRRDAPEPSSARW